MFSPISCRAPLRSCCIVRSWSCGVCSRGALEATSAGITHLIYHHDLSRQRAISQGNLRAPTRIRIHAINNIVRHCHYQRIHLDPVIQPVVLLLVVFPDFLVLYLFDLSFVTYQARVVPAVSLPLETNLFWILPVLVEPVPINALF